MTKVKKKIVIETQSSSCTVPSDIYIHYYENGKIIRGAGIQSEDLERLPENVAVIVYEFFKENFKEIFE